MAAPASSSTPIPEISGAEYPSFIGAEGLALVVSFTMASKGTILASFEPRIEVLVSPVVIRLPVVRTAASHFILFKQLVTAGAPVTCVRKDQRNHCKDLTLLH